MEGKWRKKYKAENAQATPGLGTTCSKKDTASYLEVKDLSSGRFPKRLIYLIICHRWMLNRLVL